MWLVGLGLGLVCGAAIGGVAGAFMGLFAGGIGGLVLQTIVQGQLDKQRRELDAQLKHIYDSMGDIHFRLKALEDARGAPRAEAATAAEVHATARATTQTTTGAAPAPSVAPPEAPAVPLAPISVAPVASLDDINITAPPLAPVVAATPVPELVLEPIAQAARPAAAASAAPLEMPQPVLPVQAAPAVQPAARKTAPVQETEEELDSEPAEPGFFARLLAGNLVAKAGVVILFFGVGFLLKYAYDHSILPPWTRLLGVAIASVVLFFAGRRLLEKRRLYALILMGGGFGFLYLDVFFALKWYHYIDAPIGFALFMVLGVATVLTAVRMDARALAVLGLFGAFLAPPLASTGSGSHVLLFSYYTLLNLFILAVSWFKAWRDLNLVGFGFTFVISAVWGARSYRPELFDSVEPFVVIFFVIYLAIPVLFATRQKPELKGLVDGTLVFGTPLAAAFMQARVVAGMGDHALAWSAGAAGVLYALLGMATRRREHMALLGETYIALATVFLTMTVFFALDAYPTFALWTLEGAAIVWVGLRQRRALARAFGLLLQLGAAAYFMFHYSEIARANPLFNDFIFGCVLIAVSAWLTAWLMDKHREVLSDTETGVGNLFLVWGFAWWFGAAIHAMHHGLAPQHFAAALLIFATVTLSSAELLGTWMGAAGWPALRRVAATHLGFIVATLVLSLKAGHPLAEWGALAWPLAFAAHFWILFRQRDEGLEAAEQLRELGGWAVLAVVASWEAWWLIDHGQYAGALAWAVGGMVAGWLRYARPERDIPENTQLSRLVLLWSLVVWSAAGWNWLDDTWNRSALVFAALLAGAGSALLFEVAGSVARWPDLRRAAALLLPGMLAGAGALYWWRVHPFADQGLLAWPLAFGIAWLALARQEHDDLAPAAPVQHLTLFWLLAALLVWEAHARFELAQVALQWQRAVWGAIPALLVLAVSRLADRDFWPFRLHAPLYRDGALWPLLLVMGLWSLYANLAAPGAAVPSFHLPILNPLDITQMLVLAAAWSWMRRSAPEYNMGDLIKPAFAVLAFIWVNGVALRALHYYADVPYEISAQLASILTQSTLSLLWTSCALVLMTWASRRGGRTPWTVGAVLLGVVVLKLLLNDLGNSGTVARIVSFLGVGGMLLLIGYIAPLPPGGAREADGRG